MTENCLVQDGLGNAYIANTRLILKTITTIHYKITVQNISSFQFAVAAICRCSCTIAKIDCTEIDCILF